MDKGIVIFLVVFGGILAALLVALFLSVRNILRKDREESLRKK